MTIAILLSGGVDSSVALHRIREGYDRCNVRAFYLKIWLEEELAHLGNCPWEEDIAYAKEVCQTYDVPLEIIPLQTEYWEQVVDATIRALQLGQTPSPDLLCNKHIKFGAFVDRFAPDFSYIASGHYAQIKSFGNAVSLHKGHDLDKDQTYFLASLSQSQIQKLRFPIGSLLKTEVRSLASAIGLPNKNRPDSQGICFLGKIPFNQFVRFHLGDCPGNIIEWQTNRILGQHRGLWYHTIGQRKGLGLSGGPWFTVKKDIESNVLYVSRQKIRNQQDQREFTVSEVSWIRRPNPQQSLEVKIRHGRKVIPCELHESQQGKFQVHLQEPDQGIASGQFAVFYQGDTCLGSALISN